MFRVVLKIFFLLFLQILVCGYSNKPVCSNCHIKGIKDNGNELASCRSCHTAVSHKSNIKGINDGHCEKCHNHFSINTLYLKTEFIRSIKSSSLNPHASDFMCASCHKVSNKGEVKKELIHSNDVKVCERCHNEKNVNMEAHSVNFTYEQSKYIKIPDNFPLHNGKVTCLTCHKFKCDGKRGHVKSKGYFLRVDSVSRNQFCLRCHLKAGFKRYNPHIQFDENGDIKEETCVVCHSEKPNLRKDDDRGDIELKGAVNKVCEGCHMIRNAHPTGVNHIREIPSDMLRYLKKNIKMKDIYFPVGDDNSVLCVTCHLPHQFRLIEGQAKNKYPRRTRFLSGYELCVMCHEK